MLAVGVHHQPVVAAAIGALAEGADAAPRSVAAGTSGRAAGHPEVGQVDGCEAGAWSSASPVRPGWVPRPGAPPPPAPPRGTGPSPRRSTGRPRRRAMSPGSPPGSPAPGPGGSSPADRRRGRRPPRARGARPCRRSGRRPSPRWRRGSPRPGGAGSPPSRPSEQGPPRSPSRRCATAGPARATLTRTRSSIPSRLRSASAAPRAAPVVEDAGGVRTLRERPVRLAQEQVAGIPAGVVGHGAHVPLGHEEIR